MFGNLLTEALIETDRGHHSLPGLMAAMARGEVTSFPALRPHQRPAWHMFLVQLGALALSSAGMDALPDDAESWRAALRQLTREFPDDEPWHLVTEARDKPAFLQPPAPDGLKWSPVATPDALDMLITARNHDLKRELVQEAEPQDWVFALVSLQTMEGYNGAGNHGIARMNGGSSSRALLALAPATGSGRVVDPSAWWRRDVTRLMASRPGAGLSGKALLWCWPWPEGSSLSFADLDPLFIEICRRVRLVRGAEGLVGIRATSKAARISAKDLNGVTGDPWAPVHIADNKSLTLGDSDWSYRKLCDLLFDGVWSVPELATPGADENAAPMLLIAEALSRGNSKTDGFRSRVIPVPKAVLKTMFGSLPQDLSKAQIEDIKRIDKVLRNGLALIAAEGDWDKLGKAEYARSLPARAAFDRVVDAAFFPALWAKLEAGTTIGIAAIHHRFVRVLAAAARAEFIRAAPGIPCARLMRPRAEARAGAAFEAGMRKLFRDLGTEEKTDA